MARGGTSPLPEWGSQIETSTAGGRTYRTYTSRLRRVESILTYADRWEDRPHLLQGDGRLTFAGLRRAVAEKASYLRRLGVGPGQRVTVLGWNSPDWVVNFWALLDTGAVPVLANAWWSASELQDAVNRLDVALHLVDEANRGKLPADAAVGVWSCDQFGPDTPPRSIGSNEENDAAIIIFTSGTAGRPKAVELSHRSLLAGLHQLLHVSRRLPHQVDESSGDVALHTGPLFHIGGIQTLLRAIVVGGTLVMPAGRFDPTDVLRLIQQYKVSRWSAVPTMVTRVLDHPDLAGYDLSTVQSITLGGAPVHADLLARLRAALPNAAARLPTGYGLTENGGQATAASGRDTAERPGSCGKPLPCVEIAFDARPDLPDNELLLRSPTQMTNYVGSADDTPIDAEGWLHTGDLGHIDDDGYLWITGRSKDMIIRGGENIAPAAVEQALATVPGVVESAVLGIPHSDLGEEVAAFVVVDSTDVTEGDILAALRPIVASFALPTYWQLTTTRLPTNHTHKIDKNALRASVTGGGSRWNA